MPKGTLQRIPASASRVATLRWLFLLPQLPSSPPGHCSTSMRSLGPLVLSNAASAGGLGSKRSPTPAQALQKELAAACCFVGGRSALSYNKLQPHVEGCNLDMPRGCGSSKHPEVSAQSQAIACPTFRSFVLAQSPAGSPLPGAGLSPRPSTAAQPC